MSKLFLNAFTKSAFFNMGLTTPLFFLTMLKKCIIVKLIWDIPNYAFREGLFPRELRHSKAFFSRGKKGID